MSFRSYHEYWAIIKTPIFISLYDGQKNLELEKSIKTTYPNDFNFFSDFEKIRILLNRFHMISQAPWSADCISKKMEPQEYVIWLSLPHVPD